MSENLEEIIRDLAKRGEISHISLTPSQNGKLFRGSFSPCSVFGVSFAEDADPIKALLLAIAKPRIKRRAPGKNDQFVATIPQATVDAAADPAADLM